MENMMGNKLICRWWYWCAYGRVTSRHCQFI